jgi:hypothetical protein
VSVSAIRVYRYKGRMISGKRGIYLRKLRKGEDISEIIYKIVISMNKFEIS